MARPSISGLLLVSILAHVSQGLPVSQNHRFTVYTPYWHQGSQIQAPLSRNPQDNIEKRDQLPCERGDCRSKIIDSLKLPTRSNNLYKTGWTMGGMPFSVLYMNPKPQISVRSPVAESLRSLPQGYDGDDLPLPGPERLQHNSPDNIQVQPLNWPQPTLMPTRRQYSIIPQLFVSYGWGPLGK